jgi:hypothetical protein
MSGVYSSGADAAPLALPPEPPAAEGLGGGAAEDDGDHDCEDNDVFSPLLDLLERFPDLFAQQVLQHLAPIDRTFLAQTGGVCRAAVVASDLPRAGTREEVLEGWKFVGGHAPAHGVCRVHRAAGLGQGERVPVGCADLCAPPLDMGVWRCCSGRGRVTARGAR